MHVTELSCPIANPMQISVFSECSNDILISVSLAYVIGTLLEGLVGNLASEMRC